MINQTKIRANLEVISDSARQRRIEGCGILAFERRASIMTIVLKRAPVPSADSI
jgi:hypothetical protein